MLEQLAARHPWAVEDDHVTVLTRHGERHQEIRFAREGEHVVLTTVVLGSRSVRQDAHRWRELALLALVLIELTRFELNLLV